MPGLTRKEIILEIQRQILVFGNSAMLGELADFLRVSPLLNVVERQSTTLTHLHPDLILVDAEQISPEQFSALMEICPILISVDPLTYQLTVLSFQHPANPLAEAARVVGILSLTLHQPA